MRYGYAAQMTRSPMLGQGRIRGSRTFRSSSVTISNMRCLLTFLQYHACTTWTAVTAPKLAVKNIAAVGEQLAA